MKGNNDGGERLARLLRTGKINRHGQYIDTYNQLVYENIAPTIGVKTIASSQSFVVVIE